MRHTLLVVDDEPDVVESLRDLLRRDYQVLGATRADEALSLLGQHSVHMILTDQRMPDMTGVELLDRVRRVDPQIIRLLFTGYADIDVVINAINQGNVYRYINKPWQTEELLSVIRQAADQYDLLLDRKRLVEELARERDHLRLLVDVNDAVVAHLELNALFAAIAGCLRRTLQHEHTSLALVDPDSGGLRVQALDPSSDHGLLYEGLVIPPDDSPPGQTLASREPMLFGLRDFGRFRSEFVRFLAAEGIKSLCCVPLLSPRRALGTLNVGSQRENGFSPADVDLLGQVGRPIAVAMANGLAYREIAELKNQLAEEKLYLEEELRTEFHFGQIIGESPALKRVLEEVAIVAPTDSAVLIQGETGTGKELLARAVHAQSSRRDRTFVKVNCASISAGLLESELFGHEKGAIPGATTAKVGRFELAHQGTLFLDEVGDIPLEVQPKLLRVIQDREFERLGSTRTVRVDVRLITSTNRDLTRMMAERQFRSDLYYRLNVFPLSLPPLRARREDIPLLVRYFTGQCARRLGRHIEIIPDEAMSALSAYGWPGNIRELENLVERAVILTPGTTLQVPLAELMAGPAAVRPFAEPR